MAGLRRTTCLYCEQDGRRTELVRVWHWGVCPLHSASFLAHVTAPPAGYALVPLPVLTDRGIPLR